MKTINWGIIGAGKIAHKFATDLETVQDAKLYGIASRSIDRANDFAKKYKATKAYGSYKEITQDPNIDAVYIATPHSYHRSHTTLCLKQKKAVLCEKPFAMNLVEVEEMIALAKAQNTLIMEALWTSFLPHFQYVKHLLHHEYFGKIKSLGADFGFQPQFDEHSRLFDKAVGGGSLLDIGIYPIYTALSTLGLPKNIQASAEFFKTGADSKCNMTFEYENAIAFLTSTLLKETKTEAIFQCEHGIIKIEGRFHEPSTVTLIDNEGNSKTKDFGYTTIGYSYEIEHFNQLLRDGKTESDIMTFDFSKKLIGLLDTVRNQIGLHYE